MPINAASVQSVALPHSDEVTVTELRDERKSTIIPLTAEKVPGGDAFWNICCGPV